MKKYRQLILVLLIMGLIGTGCGTPNLASKPSLDKEALSLPFIINQVDMIGDDELQLNWQELIAIIAIDQTKDLSYISEEELEWVGQLFIKDHHVLSFEEVLSQLSLSEEAITRAYENLEELKNYSYVPSKTDPNAYEMTFIDSLKQGAIENYQLYGILPSITLAQAILESDWGESELATKANNLFGIKKGVNWEGEIINIETKEGFDEYLIDEFRKYDSFEASLVDHGQFLAKNSRYTMSGVFEAKTYRQQASALEKAGYSTAQDESGNKIYAKMLGELIRQYNLQLIDHEILY